MLGCKPSRDGQSRNEELLHQATQHGEKASNQKREDQARGSSADS